MERKLLNIKKIKEIGWKKKITLIEGLTNTYRWYLTNKI